MATLREAAIALANQLGVQKEVIFGFVRLEGRLPRDIGELEYFGNNAGNNPYNHRRRDPSGAWNPIVPGPTPGTDGGPWGGDPSRKHVVANEEDSDLYPWQRQQQWGDGDIGPGTFANFGGGGGAGGGDPAAGKSVQQLEAELRTAGYPGPWDEASVRAAYARTAKGGGGSGGGSGGGLGALGDNVSQTAKKRYDEIELPDSVSRRKQIDAQIADAAGRLELAQSAEERAQAWQDFQQAVTEDARYDQQRQAELDRFDKRGDTANARFDRRDQYEKNRFDSRLSSDQARFDNRLSSERGLWSDLSQNLLKGSIELGSRPEDYFKYQQNLAGGKDIFQQLFGTTPEAVNQIPTGEIKSGNIGDLVKALGMTGVPGGWTTGEGGVPGGQGGGIAGGSAEQQWMDRSRRDAYGAEQEWMGRRGPEEPEYRPEPNLPFMPPVSNPSRAAAANVPKLKDAYAAALKRRGVEFLGQDDPELLDIYKTHFNIDDEQARIVARKAADYYKVNKQQIPDSYLSGYVAEAINNMRSPNVPAQRGRRVETAYEDEVRQSGQPYLPGSDPRTRRAWEQGGGMRPDQAAWGSDRAHEVAGARGYPARGGELVDIIERARKQPKRRAAESFAM